MQFIKSDVNINFIGKRKIAFIVSVAMILVSIISLILHGGPRQGIDFAGGTLIQVKFLAPVKIDDIKAGLQSIGLGKSSVQSFGEQESNEYLIRTDSSVMAAEGFSVDVEKALAASQKELEKLADERAELERQQAALKASSSSLAPNALPRRATRTSPSRRLSTTGSAVSGDSTSNRCIRLRGENSATWILPTGSIEPA